MPANTKRKRMTAKQRVLKKYPRAYFCWRHYAIHPEYISLTKLGNGPSARAAWADAARRL